MKIVRIGQQEIGDGHPCYILAEAGCNHNQRLDVAKKLIDMAVRSGVDSIKFQTYKAELMYSKKTPMMKHFKDRLTAKDDATMYDLIKMTELPYDMHAPIVNYCKKNNIPFLSTPFDEESVDQLIELEDLSLDLDKKDFSIVATIKKLKGDCALGNCEELTMHNRKLPFLSETHEYLKIGEEDVNQVTINKKTLGLVWYSYYWYELSNGTYEKRDSYGYYSCKKINKFPFK